MIKDAKKLIKRFIRLILDVLYILYWKFQFKKDTVKPTAFLFRISRWKYSFLPYFLREYNVQFVPFGRKINFLKYQIEKYKDKVFIIWGYNEEEEILDYARKNNISVYRIEDGFVRSKGLGSMHSPPYSICLDKQGMYFDSSQPSDLEDILNNYNFDEDKDLLLRARICIEKLKELGVSKYNHVDSKKTSEIYGEKHSRRILVIGQVEDDASIKKGSTIKYSNNDLVKIAYEENPKAEIIYKPHPDVLTGRRKKQSDPNEIRHIAKVIEEPLSLIDAFETIDHVYTITSLSGFEALIRGIPVTTLGAPFYSGWGLTDDRQIVDRRKRNLTIVELFAGAYILYPRYVDPYKGKSLSLEETIEQINSQK